MHKDKYKESQGLKHKYISIMLIIVKHIQELFVQIVWLCYTMLEDTIILYSRTCGTDYNIILILVSANQLRNKCRCPV